MTPSTKAAVYQISKSSLVKLRAALDTLDDQDVINYINSRYGLMYTVTSLQITKR